MKKLSQIFEHCLTDDVNPGNDGTLGVTNHYTPIDNIVMNIKNFYASLSIVVAVAEDGVSLKIHSSRFTSEENVSNIMNTIVCGKTLDSYITEQGLNGRKLKNLGMYYVLYCMPTDIKSANANTKAEQPKFVVTDKVAQGDNLIPNKVKPSKTFKIKESIDDESELCYITEASEGDDEEIADITKKKVVELIATSDKVKAAKQLELLVRQEIELPNEYYFAGVTTNSTKKSSIALRWKYTKQTDVDVTTEIIKTLINIHGGDKPYCFVPDFAEKSMFHLPDEVKTLIDNIIEFLGAKKTSNPCKFEFESSDYKKDDEGDKKDDEGNKGNDLNGDDKGSSDKKDDSSSGDDLLG